MTHGRAGARNRSQCRVALFRPHEGVGAGLAKPLRRAIGPPDLDGIHLGVRAEPEVQPDVAVREVAVAAAALGALHEIAGADGDEGADGGAIGPACVEIDDQIVAAVAAVVAQDRRRAVEIVDDDVEVAVVVEIADGRAAADRGLAERGAGAMLPRSVNVPSRLLRYSSLRWA